MIPVVDIFAGPGGLGEGFSSFRDSRGNRAFELAVSIEKDHNAHATLRLRALWRRMNHAGGKAYRSYLSGPQSWEALRENYPAAAAAAESEARLIELGPETVQEVRRLLNDTIRQKKPWVLVGGPPCQAYSIVGRSRNKGNVSYRPHLDKRQTLYVEYLQILADHAPPVFVMENVKGLLSAQLETHQLFDRIRDDLRDPARALKREERSTGSRNPNYDIRALVHNPNLPGEDPRGYVVRSERFGIPQRRHRVILVGVRSDLSPATVNFLQEKSNPATVRESLNDLPRLRSGLSRRLDSGLEWARYLKGVNDKSWLTCVDASTRERIQGTLEKLSVPAASRGSNYSVSRNGETVLNHESRSHIGEDLERYLFASCYAATHSISPGLSEFPKSLLPNHANVRPSGRDTIFSDRFRVQVAGQPATTITSHISKDGHYYIHPDPSQCRSLTVREAARLQTFPDDYFFCGPRTSQYQQVGNAVPPALARQIAGIIADLVA